MWSRKGKPVSICDRPAPSRFSLTRTSVSLVLRRISATREDFFPGFGIVFRKPQTLRRSAMFIERDSLKTSRAVRTGGIQSGKVLLKFRPPVRTATWLFWVRAINLTLLREWRTDLQIGRAH